MEWAIWVNKLFKKYFGGIFSPSGVAQKWTLHIMGKIVRHSFYIRKLYTIISLINSFFAGEVFWWLLLCSSHFETFANGRFGQHCPVELQFKKNADIVFKTVHAATIKFLYDPENYATQQRVLQHFGRLNKKNMVTMPPGDNFFHDDGNKVLRNIAHFCEHLQDMTLIGFKIDLDSPIYSSKDG